MDALPELSDFKTLDATAIRDFQQNGHVLIKKVLNQKEVSSYRNAIVHAAHKFNTEKRDLKDRDTYGKAFLQIMNLWRVDERVKKFVMARRFAKIAADLLGVDNVRIYHDQALFKEAGGGPTPWHQDQYYWPVDTTNTVTMWMPLMDIDVEMGMLTFASGSHKKGYVFDFEISDESESTYNDYIKSEGFPVQRADAMHAGDASFHYGFTIHNAPANKSEHTREVMTVIYLADGAKVIQPKNKYQEADLATWMLNLPLGSKIETELNPLLL